jgi:cation:H+ antiporter
VPVAAGGTGGGGRRRLGDVALVLGGLGLLVLGSRLLVGAATEIARALGVSELVIGLTVLAVGTSLPEAATSLLAALRGEREIAVGNVVGSNILNLLAVLGVSAVAAPGGIPVAAAALRFDVPVMLASTIACLPVFLTGHRIDRWEGGLFLCYYVAYVAYLILAAARHDALPVLSGTTLAFVVPLVLVTVLVVARRSARPSPPA